MDDTRLAAKPAVQPQQIELPDRLKPSAGYILETQGTDGEIPWFEGGVVDPWDHVEAAMGLTVAGHWQAAEAAYYWLSARQLPDGGWWAAYQGRTAVDTGRRETNFIAYIATGVWHHYLVTGNPYFLARLWSTVEAAIDFVVARQRPRGEIPWAEDARGATTEEALLTGCCSIYKSLECALRIADALHHHKPEWRLARTRLGEALRRHPEPFDQSKNRYSMDWFYPVLCAVLPGAEAHERLQGRRRAEFMEPGLGCRCVSDRPWVTVAESCELTMALLATGQVDAASRLFGWLDVLRDEQGVYWTGYAIDEDVFWPYERPTWTAGAALLAGDALHELTPATGLFTGSNHPEAGLTQ